MLLDAARDPLGDGPTAADFRRVRAMLVRVFTRPPTPQDRREFLARLDALVRRAAGDIQATQARFDELKVALRPARRARAGPESPPEGRGAGRGP